MSNRSRRDFLKSSLVAAAMPQGGAHVSRTSDRYLNPRRVLLWECTRKEIREAMQSGRLKAAMVPTGSTEQHNEHLAMIHDTASATLVAQNAALQLYPSVIVTTPVPIGISPHWMDRKGTLTLRPETFLAVVYDICDSLKTHGIKSILIVNGHGGNDKPLKGQVEEWRSKLGVNIEACSYWDGYTSENAGPLMQSGMKMVPGHSAEFETSIGLCAFPERVHREGVEYSKTKLDIKSERDAEEDAMYYRDSLLATAEKGEALLRIAVDWVVDRMRRML
jgi:creatinine amidohydrolase